ncbi:hypothetical protein FAM09_00665 [Niastella caeni]|uniref:Uncharacterized protein n=1 Tax=Niastella caeni TaxID=2569763 RepID=A0A4S8I0H2_9BACT|nr:hypothetical protein [Niastella caeni]THU40659.1 hypothetical protein FAM09_00665 [Niastella caeni]
MKKVLVNGWPALLLLFLVASCGKEISSEEDLGQYYLKCKIGNVDKTFNFFASADKEDLGGGASSYAIIGKAVADASNFESLAFSIQLSIPFTPGTYTVADPTTDYLMIGLYNPNTTDSEKIFVSQENESDPFQVTFTEITSTTISGTFKGKLFLNNSADPNATADSVVISNGQFKLKVQ